MCHLHTRVGVVGNIRFRAEWPVPSTEKQIQSFLGTCVYVSKFCKDFAELSAPLTEATRGKSSHEKVILSPEQLQCFHKLKNVLTAPPILAHPDFSRDFHVRMDASDFAVGGYLFQVDSKGNEHVIAFGGRKMTSAELMYPTREKELLAALHAMRTWRVYLLDRPFYINTDHKTLQSILEQKTCSQRLARWLNELGMYRPMFRWIPGDTNVIADMVSRNPSFHPAESAHYVSLADLLRQLTASQAHLDSDEVRLRYMRGRPTILQQCVNLYTEDEVFGVLYAFLRESTNSTGSPPVQLNRTLRANIQHFFVEDKVLYFQPDPESPRRVCVPSDPDLRNSILFEKHNVATSGHPGCLKTLLAVQEQFYWLHMERSVKRYVRSCEMCQRVKASHRKPAGLLHPLQIPRNRWSDISMDFVTGLPKARRSKCDAVMVIVDRLTKRAHFIVT